MNHVNIVFATPGHSLLSDYVKSLLPTIQTLNQLGISWGFSNEYSSHVGDAREITLNGGKVNNILDSRPFGGTSYDKVMWIDSDIYWKPEDILKLYNSDKDIIAGSYRIANGDITVYNELFGPAIKEEELNSHKEPFKVFGAGMGFMCIKSGIFEKMKRPWFQQEIGSANINGELIEFPLIGEDLSFCKRVADMGFEVWVDPTVRVGHHKMVRLDWNNETSAL